MRPNLCRVQSIENGFLIFYADLVKVKERFGMAGPPGYEPPEPQSPQDVTRDILVERTRYCATAQEVAEAIRSICEQATKLKAFLDDRGGEPGLFTQA